MHLGRMHNHSARHAQANTMTQGGRAPGPPWWAAWRGNGWSRRRLHHSPPGRLASGCRPPPCSQTAACETAIYSLQPCRHGMPERSRQCDRTAITGHPHDALGVLFGEALGLVARRHAHVHDTLSELVGMYRQAALAHHEVQTAVPAVTSGRVRHSAKHDVQPAKRQHIAWS